MVKSWKAGLAVLLLATAVGLWVTRDTGSRDPEGPSAAGRGVGTRTTGGELPQIRLERLELGRSGGPVGQRDIFDYGPAPAPSVDQQVTPTPPLRPGPTPAVVATPIPAARMGQALPPVKVTFIGSAERQGLKVAVLLTDQQEILTGQVGQLVGNRFRIVEIGLESVDIQDVGSERVRRIPLKGS